MNKKNVEKRRSPYPCDACVNEQKFLKRFPFLRRSWYRIVWHLFLFAAFFQDQGGFDLKILYQLLNMHSMWTKPASNIMESDKDPSFLTMTKAATPSWYLDSILLMSFYRSQPGWDFWKWWIHMNCMCHVNLHRTEMMFIDQTWQPSSLRTDLHMLLNLTFQHHSLALLSFPIDESGADFWLHMSMWGDFMFKTSGRVDEASWNILKHEAKELHSRWHWVANSSSPLPIDIAFIGLLQRLWRVGILLFQIINWRSMTKKELEEILFQLK